jgi:hypothetical protein
MSKKLPVRVEKSVLGRISCGLGSATEFVLFFFLGGESCGGVGGLRKRTTLAGIITGNRFRG